LFVFKTPVTEIQLSVTLNFDFRFVAAGSDEADYSLHDLSLRCEPLETEYDDYMTYYQKMEFENQLPSFAGFFKKGALQLRPSFCWLSIETGLPQRLRAKIRDQ
jgi:hypothetical protein